MNWSRVLFSTQGRLAPGPFRNAGILLTAIGVAIALAPLISPMLYVLSVISLVLIYPWTVIWVKRLHDSGKSGWLFLAVAAVWIVVSLVVSSLITSRFGPPAAAPANPADVAAVMQDAFARARAVALPSAVASVVLSLIFIFGGNALLRSDPGPNAYGPPTEAG